MPSYAREPILKPVPIDDLRPTQISVGMWEVEEKRKRLRARGEKKLGDYLGDHMIPVVLGPKQLHYIIDHHHLVLTLHLEGIKEVLVTVVADLSDAEDEVFWHILDQNNWVHPYDEGGRRREFSEIPKSIEKLKDDPFRSSCRRAAPRRRICKRHDGLQRIPLGRFLPRANQAQVDRGRLCLCCRRGLEARPRPRRPLSAGLVRADPVMTKQTRIKSGTSVCLGGFFHVSKKDQ